MYLASNLKINLTNYFKYQLLTLITCIFKNLITLLLTKNSQLLKFFHVTKYSILAQLLTLGRRLSVQQREMGNTKP